MRYLCTSAAPRRDSDLLYHAVLRYHATSSHKRKVSALMRNAPKVGAVFFIVAAASLWAQNPAERSRFTPSGLTGTWQSEAVPFWTVVLKADGSTLTGAVNSCSSSPMLEITDGRVEGNAIAFKCRSADGDRTLSFAGTFHNGEIAMTWGATRSRGRPSTWSLRPVFTDE